MRVPDTACAEPEPEEERPREGPLYWYFVEKLLEQENGNGE